MFEINDNPSTEIWYKLHFGIKLTSELNSELWRDVRDVFLQNVSLIENDFKDAKLQEDVETTNTFYIIGTDIKQIKDLYKKCRSFSEGLGYNTRPYLMDQIITNSFNIY